MESVAVCSACGAPLTDGALWVLVRRRRRIEHCSEPCLRIAVRRQQQAAAVARRRWSVRLLVVAALLAGGRVAWLRLRTPKPATISLAWAEAPPRRPPPAPILYGPAWPPTDDDWRFAFERASWVYPLEGPIRRPPRIDAHVFASEGPKRHATRCREEGRCAVDLGGEIWGEHVHAATDGIVDRAQGWGGDPRGGHYVRLSHFGGLVFTEYFHLAALPRSVRRGAHVHAGDVIGLLGDTGLEGAERHLHFALSTWPSPAFPEVYWDPTPFMATWPLQIPTHGTVTGYVPGPR